MKKIVALALCLIMALSLATVAFAGTDPVTVTGSAYRDTNEAAAVAEETTLTFHAAVAAVTNTDGKQTNEANVAYYTCNKVGGNFVVVDSLAAADLVVYSDTTAKNVILYLAKANVKYYGTGTVFTNFGDKCGQVAKPDTYDATKTYYTTNYNGDTAIYVADAEGPYALMVGGKLVNVNGAVANTAAAKKHVTVPTVVDGKVTGYTCATCKAAAVKAANVASIPATAEVVEGTLYYFPAAGTTAAGVTSAKTFDAGVALYAGMALMSVAGSAVVIGKKKEF